MKAEFLYRDGANYKDYLTLEVGDRKFEPEEEVTFEELGTTFEEQFEREKNEEFDHNILEFVDYFYEEGNDLPFPKKVTFKITVEVEHSLVMNSEEELKMFIEERQADIYLHGEGEHGHYRKEDLGGSTKIEVLKQEDYTPEPKIVELPSVWEFVEKYYPNYYSCDEIAHADDLSKIINNEHSEDEESDCYELWQEILTQFNGNEEEAMKDAKYRYNEHHITIYNKAIEGLGVKPHNIYEWVTSLIGDNNDKVVRYTELVCRDIKHKDLTHDEQDEMMQLRLEVREEAIEAYIKQKGGL